MNLVLLWIYNVEGDFLFPTSQAYVVYHIVHFVSAISCLRLFFVDKVFDSSYYRLYLIDYFIIK